METICSQHIVITNCNPQDLPEGASPRTWDTDFIIGSVFTRAGLVSVYTYASTLLITEVVVGSASLATFTYEGTTPVLNEGFILENFTGTAEFLDGQTVVVLSVNSATNTFTAEVVNGIVGTYSGLLGRAISTTGLFIGPNAPSQALDIDTADNPWTNVDGVLGNTSYAFVTTGNDFGEVVTPTEGANFNNTGIQWTNPGNASSTVSVATVVVGVGQTASPLLASNVSPAVPATATVLGVSASFQASFTYSATSSGSQGPNACTSAVNVGSGEFAWDNPTNIENNNSMFANVDVAAGNSSLGLAATAFGFGVPLGSTILGITLQANNYKVDGHDQDGYLEIQLLKAGSLVGTVLKPVPPTVPTVESYGSSSYLWGTTWTPADINNSGFGVQFIGVAPVVGNPPKFPAGPADFYMGYVTLTVTYSNGGVTGSASVSVQLASKGSAIGTPLSTGITSSLMPYTLGSPSYFWGTSLTAATINDPSFGLLLTAIPGSPFSSGTTYTFDANSMALTVYYLVPESDELQAQTFVFSIPITNGITGIETTFQAYSSANTTVTMQLLKNGVPVGNVLSQQLTTVPTIYSLGGSQNLWGTTWFPSDLNSLSFGVQIVATGNGTTNVNDVDALAYITPALAAFDYVKSYIENDGQTYTLALDSTGIMWQEDVTNDPKVLSVSLTGILPGSFAQSSTMNNREHICFSDLAIGTDRPRTFNGSTYYPLSQIGPGAPPTFTISNKSGGSVLQVTAYSNPSTDIITFVFTALTPPFTPVVGSLYTIAGTGNAGLDGSTFSVLGTPAPSTVSFSVDSTATGSASGLTATASPTNFYSIKSITQDLLSPNVGGAVVFNGQLMIWSAPGSYASPGFTVTCFYGGTNVPENAGLSAALNSGLYPVYVYISGAPFGNGTQLVTGHGTGAGPNQKGPIPYFTFLAGSSSHIVENNNGQFQMTAATITTNLPIPNLTTGAQIQIAGVTPPQWNNTWTILDSLLSGSYDINSSQMLSGGVAQFQYSNASATGQPTVTNGQLIELSGLTGNPLFNTVGVVSAATGSSFQISGFPAFTPAQIAEGVIPENGQAATFGTEFIIDPGPTFVGTANSPIFGNDTGTGTLTVIGGSLIPIGAGIRQGVVYFITETEYETMPSAPFVFTTPEGTDEIVCSDVPIGPPDTIARALAFTEAGQNGVPGANFYVIEEPVTTTVNGVITTVPSTIINDNTTTQISLSFTDAVLLNSREIDVQGDDLFNLIELGSCGWCVPYAERMFYGLQLNKINNWTSGGGLTFDAGYLPNPTGLIQPLGWSLANTVDQTLVTSTVAGQALYIKSTYNVVTPQVGLIYQTAYQDPYLVAIIQPNTAYSVRVACDAPSGNMQGTLTIDLTDYSSIGFGKTYGSFTVPLSSMSTVMQVFAGTLLTTPFTNSVSTLLQIRVFLSNAGPGADCLIDRIEVFPTLTPYLKAQVYGSYVGQPETIDASSTGGIIDTTSENAQAVMGGFVMHDLLYLMKTASWYSTQADPNSEPGGWSLKEVSNKVGTIGINSYDTGEEWCVTACRSGIYGFDGGQPMKITQELWNLWEQINWQYGNTIVLRNDVVSKRLYCAIPLPTGTNPATGLPANKYTILWLPNAPYNPNPTTPNVMLMLNYQGLANIQEMMNSPEVHTTMFGTLAAVDMKRKWSIWNIATPYMQFIMQPDGESIPLYICNGIGTSKIYTLDQDQTSDDGVAINSLYTTYGFVNAAKAATLPIFGFHAKRYTVLQVSTTGTQLTNSTATNLKMRILPNTINPKYPYTVPIGIPLVDPANDDYFRPINVKGNRAFIEVSTNAVGSAFNLSKLLLTGKADAWSTLNPTGGGNAGIV